MEDDILEQEDDLIEEEMKEMEKTTKISKKSSEKTPQDKEETVHETWEAFNLPQRMGLTNTVTGETMEGFKEDESGIVLVLKKILNQLDKIAIAQGA